MPFHPPGAIGRTRTRHLLMIKWTHFCCTTQKPKRYALLFLISITKLFYSKEGRFLRDHLIPSYEAQGLAEWSDEFKNDMTHSLGPSQSSHNEQTVHLWEDLDPSSTFPETWERKNGLKHNISHFMLFIPLCCRLNVCKMWLKDEQLYSLWGRIHTADHHHILQ